MPGIEGPAAIAAHKRCEGIAHNEGCEDGSSLLKKVASNGEGDDEQDEQRQLHASPNACCTGHGAAAAVRGNVCVPTLHWVTDQVQCTA